MSALEGRTNRWMRQLGARLVVLLTSCDAPGRELHTCPVSPCPHHPHFGVMHGRPIHNALYACVLGRHTHVFDFVCFRVGVCEAMRLGCRFFKAVCGCGAMPVRDLDVILDVI